jgi:hypothetical protein
MRFPLTATVYDFALSCYFWISIGRRGEALRVQCEPVWHLAAYLLPLSFGVAGITTESFNYAALTKVCKFGTLPKDCTDRANVKCMRGGQITQSLNLGYVSLVFLLSILSVITTIAVFLKVRRQLRRSIRRSFRSDPRLGCATIGLVHSVLSERINVADYFRGPIPTRGRHRKGRGHGFLLFEYHGSTSVSALGFFNGIIYMPLEGTQPGTILVVGRTGDSWRERPEATQQC